MAGSWTKWDRLRRLEEPGLACSELRVLLVLMDFADQAGLAWPSSKTIGDRLGMDDSNVRKVLSKLVGKGLIKRSGRSAKSTRYLVCPRPNRVTSHPDSDPHPGTPSPAYPGDQSPVPDPNKGDQSPAHPGEPSPGPRVTRYPQTSQGTSQQEPPRKDAQARATPSTQLSLNGAATEPERSPIDRLIDALWEDFNRARAQTVGQGLRELSEKRRRLARGAVKPWRGLVFEEARRLGQRAVAWQFKDPFLRRKGVDSWESLCRHLESWSEKGEQLEGLPAGASMSPNALAARRWLERKQREREASGSAAR